MISKEVKEIYWYVLVRPFDYEYFINLSDGSVPNRYTTRLSNDVHVEYYNEFGGYTLKAPPIVIK